MDSNASQGHGSNSRPSHSRLPRRPSPRRRPYASALANHQADTSNSYSVVRPQHLQPGYSFSNFVADQEWDKQIPEFQGPTVTSQADNVNYPNGLGMGSLDEFGYNANLSIPVPAPQGSYQGATYNETFLPPLSYTAWDAAALTNYTGHNETIDSLGPSKGQLTNSNQPEASVTLGSNSSGRLVRGVTEPAIRTAFQSFIYDSPDNPNVMTQQGDSGQFFYRPSGSETSGILNQSFEVPKKLRKFKNVDKSLGVWRCSVNANLPPEAISRVPGTAEEGIKFSQVSFIKPGSQRKDQYLHDVFKKKNHYEASGHKDWAHFTESKPDYLLEVDCFIHTKSHGKLPGTFTMVLSAPLAQDDNQANETAPEEMVALGTGANSQ